MQMTNEELLEALNKRFDSIDSRLEKIETDVSQLKEDVAQLKEDSEITRTGVNALIEWAEDVSNAIRFPLPRLK